MSMPFYLHPPPAMASPEHSYTATAGHSGSIGPFVAVLVVVIVLCILSGIAGRLCSGQTILGYGDFDIEKWAETKFSACIDGRIPPPPPPPPVQNQEEVEKPESPQINRANNTANVRS